MARVRVHTYHSSPFECSSVHSCHLLMKSKHTGHLNCQVTPHWYMGQNCRDEFAWQACDLLDESEEWRIHVLDQV